MKLARRIFGGLTVALCACSGSTTQPNASGTIGIAADVSALRNDGSLAHVTVTVLDAQGHPASGSVAFTASAGSLNGSGTTALSAALDTAGRATVTYACDVSMDPARCGPGSVAVNATWSGVTNGMRLTLQGLSSSPDAGSPDAGSPGGTDAGTGGSGSAGPPASVIATSTVPAILGLKGSGIQETGVTTFLVTDAAGRPVSNLAVTFGQRQPALVTLGRTTATTGSDGTASVDYSSGSEVGVSAITASIAAGAGGSQAIAVRGAKPSAAGFYFRCEKGNLPAYQTTPALETMTCEVRLSDRYGNRVGIPTPVRFATEAGSIDSFAMTKGFDPANPNDPTEGTAVVTFTTDMGNGFRPADVAPLLAAPSQYPWPRQAEPQELVGSVTRNPRDQLVTLIAMTDGEEAFVDANHNGSLDANEVFYDLGDPFIDANDDGAYDQVYTGGPWETRFCSDTTNCSSYNGPNGVWDSATTIWVPTWVAFTDNAWPHTAAAGVPEPTWSYSPQCVAEGAATFASIYVFDEFMNSPAAGTTYTDPVLDKGDPKITVAKHGFFEEPDNWGAMGKYGLDFDYWPVLPGGGACAAPASPTAPTACVLKLFFMDFEDGFRGTIEADNTLATGGTCPALKTFVTSIGTVNVKGPTLRASQSGQYAP